MAKLDLLLKALDTAVWEMGEAFQGLPDEDVWRRPHPRLLSVGELAAHVAYWEAKSIVGDAVESPLFVEHARYYTVGVESPLLLELGSAAVYDEVKRVHEAAKAAFTTASPDSEAPNDLRKGWTWGTTLEYQAFHVAYHTGQMYSVRHLFGHETVDN